jgi:Phage integrase family
MPYCSKSPHASCGESWVVIQNASKSRATSDGSIFALDYRARRDQRIAQPLMISLEMMMRDILMQRTTQHLLPDRYHFPQVTRLYAIASSNRKLDAVTPPVGAWEVPVPELSRSVFMIPPEAFKSKRAHVVILNDAAWSIVQAQRGLDPIWVFPHRGRRMSTMNNTAWQRVRREAGLCAVRIHELRHRFGCRLRAAGVSAEDCKALLGHASHTMAGRYASADVGRLIKQANLVLNREGTCSVLRIAKGPARQRWIKGPAALETTSLSACNPLNVSARQDLNPRPPGS